MAVSDLGRRAFSFFLLWAVVIGVVVAQWELGYALFIVGMGCVGLGEFFWALGHKGIRSFRKTGVAAGFIFLTGQALILSGRIPSPGHSVFELVCLLLFFLGVMVRQVFAKERATPVVTMAVTVFGVLYVPWLFSFVFNLLYFTGDYREGAHLLLYLVVVTKFTDAGAYLTGRFFGRHKMAPLVSPKKTWEGFAGGVLAAVLSSVALVHYLGGAVSLIPPAWAIPLGIVLAMASVVGDLAESMVKRDTDVKDSGGFIPGIGGALDLIDSVLFTGPMLYLFLVALSRF
jgi:phosphatidate cytidylyltransferase